MVRERVTSSALTPSPAKLLHLALWWLGFVLTVLLWPRGPLNTLRIGGKTSLAHVCCVGWIKVPLRTLPYVQSEGNIYKKSIFTLSLSAGLTSVATIFCLFPHLFRREVFFFPYPFPSFCLFRSLWFSLFPCFFHGGSVSPSAIIPLIFVSS